MIGPWADGFDAQRAGVLETENPFRSEVERQRWLYGYRRAQRDMANAEQWADAMRKVDAEEERTG